MSHSKPKSNFASMQNLSSAKIFILTGLLASTTQVFAGKTKSSLPYLNTNCGPDQVPICNDQREETSIPFCVERGYEEHIMPGEGTTKLPVKIHIRHNDIEDINFVGLSMRVHFHMTMVWRDPRVQRTNACKEKDSREIIRTAMNTKLEEKKNEEGKYLE